MFGDTFIKGSFPDYAEIEKQLVKVASRPDMDMVVYSNLLLAEYIVPFSMARDNYALLLDVIKPDERGPELIGRIKSLQTSMESLENEDLGNVKVETAVICDNDTYDLLEKYKNDKQISSLKKIRIDSLEEDLYAVLSKGIEDVSQDYSFTKNYMILDLKDYSVSYLPDVPAGGWKDEYKTEKLVLRYIPEGKFVMGTKNGQIGCCADAEPHEVRITKPFYIGVFEVTQKQYELICGKDPSKYKGPTRPVERVSYDMIRGRLEGNSWPRGRKVDPNSFLGILRGKSKLQFDLPTEAQWEYACRAGTETSLNDGTEITNCDHCPNMDKLGRYARNNDDGKGGFAEHTVVGCYRPNRWGLYDMHGNVWEWCLDWTAHFDGPEVDPVGPDHSYARVMKGGGWGYTAAACNAGYRDYDQCYPDCDDDCNGFRLALTLDEY
jgi:formylglycine-generating enzyme required for sulfatase activity